MNNDHITISTVLSKIWKLLKENFLFFLLYLVIISSIRQLLPSVFSTHDSILRYIYSLMNHFFMFFVILLTYVIIYDLYYYNLGGQGTLRNLKKSLKYIRVTWDKFVITLPMFVFYIITSKCFSVMSSWLITLQQTYSFPFHLGWFLILIPFNFAMFIAIFLMAFHQRSFLNSLYFSYRLIFCRRYFWHSFVYMLVSAIPSFLIFVPFIYISNSDFAFYFPYSSLSLIFTIANLSTFLIDIMIIAIFSESMMQKLKR